MKDYLEYTREVFEQPYTTKEVDFECVKDLAQDGFCRCICIPGIVVNYIAAVIKCCFKDVEGTNHVWWNDGCQTYIPETAYQQKTVVFNLKKDSVNRECWFSNELCVEAAGDFCYIIIRQQDLDREIAYKKREQLLWGKKEEFNNSTDCFRLFCMVASTYHKEYDMVDFSDKLFRLFLFLFPEQGLDIIKDNYIRSHGHRGFMEYHSKLLDAFLKLGRAYRKCKRIDFGYGNSLMLSIHKFTGFDFYNVYNMYREDGVEVQILKDLLGIHLNICEQWCDKLERARFASQGQSG